MNFKRAIQALDAEDADPTLASFIVNEASSFMASQGFSELVPQAELDHTAVKRDLAEFIESHVSEFGDYDITAHEIIARSPVFERFEHGFAVILKPETCDMELWFLYVDPDHRGRRLGREYMRRLLRKYPTYVMTLHCHKRLRPFYGSLGFKVTHRDGDYRRMQG